MPTAGLSAAFCTSSAGLRNVRKPFFFPLPSTSWIMWFCKSIPSSRTETTKNLHRKTRTECVSDLYIVMKLHYVPYSKTKWEPCVCGVCVCVRARVCIFSGFKILKEKKKSHREQTLLRVGYCPSLQQQWDKFLRVEFASDVSVLNASICTSL